MSILDRPIHLDIATHFIVRLLFLLSQLICELIDLCFECLSKVLESDYHNCDVIHGLLRHR